MGNNSYLRHILNWIAYMLSPWHDNGLPEHLQFGEIESEGFVRSFMLRTASLSVGVNLKFGIFDIIGMEHARRALWAWRPRHILLMEDLSLAFYPIFSQTSGPFPVPEIHIERTLEILCRHMRRPCCGDTFTLSLNLPAHV